MRLLVVLKWLPQAAQASKCDQILGKFDERSSLYQKTADGFYHHHQMLQQGWRLPPLAIPAAVDVLTTNTYSRLPYRIKASENDARFHFYIAPRGAG
jgi:hypothetical protein